MTSRKLTLEEEIATVQAWVDLTVAGNLSEAGECDESAAAADFAFCERLLFQTKGCDSPDGLLANRMRNVSRLGFGTYGVVFRARDSRLNRDVAIKVLRPSAKEVPTLVHRFELEANALARCSFEGILPIYEVGKVGGLPYLITRLACGPNLAEVLDFRQSPYDPKIAVGLMKQIGNAVSQAHQQGVLHRDLKPANILTEEYTTDGKESRLRIFVCDFGLAKDLTQEDAIRSEDVGHQVVGTVRYMSPEQVLGERNSISVASDLFSLGIILYEMLTLKHPFGGDSKIDMLHRIAYSVPAPMQRWNRKIPSDLEAIVAKCLHKDPLHRYRSGGEFLDDLTAWESGLPIQAKSTSRAERFWLFMKRNPVTTVLSALLVTSVIAGVITAGMYFVDNRKKMRFAQSEARRADENTQFALRALKTYQTAAEKLLLDVPQSNQKKLELHLEALKFYKEHAERCNYDEKSTHLLSIAHHYVANAAHNVFDREVELEHREQHYVLAKRLSDVYPTNASYHYDLFMNRFLTGPWFKGQIRGHEYLDEARNHLKRAMELRPGNVDYEEALIGLEYTSASDSWDVNPDYAKERLQVALKLAEEHADRYPEHPKAYKHLVNCLIHLAEIRIGEPVEARRVAERALHLQSTKLVGLEAFELGWQKLRILQVLVWTSMREPSDDWELRLEEFVEFCFQESDRDGKYEIYRINAASALLEAAERSKSGKLVGDWRAFAARADEILKGFEVNVPDVPEHVKMVEDACKRVNELGL